MDVGTSNFIIYLGVVLKLQFSLGCYVDFNISGSNSQFNCF